MKEETCNMCGNNFPAHTEAMNTVHVGDESWDVCESCKQHYE